MTNHLAQLNINFDTLNQSTGLKTEFTGTGAIGKIITDLLPYIFGIAGLIMFLYIVYAGFSLMTSRGDSDAAAAARNKLTYAIIGFIVIFASFWIIQILTSILGIGNTPFGSSNSTDNSGGTNNNTLIQQCMVLCNDNFSDYGLSSASECPTACQEVVNQFNQ